MNRKLKKIAKVGMKRLFLSILCLSLILSLCYRPLKVQAGAVTVVSLWEAFQWILMSAGMTIIGYELLDDLFEGGADETLEAVMGALVASMNSNGKGTGDKIKEAALAALTASTLPGLMAATEIKMARETWEDMRDWAEDTSRGRTEFSVSKVAHPDSMTERNGLNAFKSYIEDFTGVPFSLDLYDVMVKYWNEAITGGYSRVFSFDYIGNPAPDGRYYTLIISTTKSGEPCHYETYFNYSRSNLSSPTGTDFWYVGDVPSFSSPEYAKWNDAVHTIVIYSMNYTKDFSWNRSRSLNYFLPVSFPFHPSDYTSAMNLVPATDYEGKLSSFISHPIYETVYCTGPLVDVKIKSDPGFKSETAEKDLVIVTPGTTYEDGELVGDVTLPIPGDIADVLDDVLTGTKSIPDALADVDVYPLVDADEKAIQDAVDKVGTSNPPAPSPEVPTYQYGVSLKEFFPFCIPFDVVDFLGVLDAEPQAPAYTFKMPVGYNGKEVKWKEFTISLEPFSSVAAVVRQFELLAFIVGLAVATRSLFIRS